jgi:hypothetical protein
MAAQMAFCVLSVLQHSTGLPFLWYARAGLGTASLISAPLQGAQSVPSGCTLWARAVHGTPQVGSSALRDPAALCNELSCRAVEVSSRLCELRTNQCSTFMQHPSAGLSTHTVRRVIPQ